MAVEDFGASADAETGSRASTEPPVSRGFGPTGFDPARLSAMFETEQRILDALNDAYQRGRMEYCHFSPAWDATAARLAALGWLINDETGG